MNYVSFLPTVQIKPSPAGAALLWALHQTAQELGRDLVVTSGNDGTHSGPADPHFAGNAFDVRSHDMDPSAKDAFVRSVLSCFGLIQASSGGYVTDDFFGWLEDAGGANEHYHFQLRKGHVYPPVSNAGTVQQATLED
jgi:hypothetical protein